jgi:RimJ/RimL family protein N-acetyltransferase
MISRRLFYTLLSFLVVSLVCPNAHSSSVDWENAYWDTYSNTLPSLSAQIGSTEKSQNNQKLLLTKMTRNTIDNLESLANALERKAQTRPKLSPENSSRLLAGNDNSKIPGISGWIIQLEEEDTLTPVGFIAYGHHRDAYYGDSYPTQPHAYGALFHKRCYEIEWYVNPSHQRRGIASAALDLVTNYCRTLTHEASIDYLLAVISPANALSAQFANNKGFQSLGRDVGTNQNIWALPLRPSP